MYTPQPVRAFYKITTIQSMFSARTIGLALKTSLMATDYSGSKKQELGSLRTYRCKHLQKNI